MEQQTETCADRLIKHFGGREKAADALGVSGETLRLWRLKGISPNAALDVERDSKGVVTAEEAMRERLHLERQQAEARAS